MYNTRKVTENIHYVGASDRRLERFENLFTLPNGVSYNSYVILDDKTAVLDTVDYAVTERFIENVLFTLNGRDLDYIVVNHMEPDHCRGIVELWTKFPNLKIVGNKKTFQMLEQFFDVDLTKNYLEVKENDEISLGKHTLKFICAPMVHWPEVMMTYEKSQGILFSADAFGTFGALNGNIFYNEVDFLNLYLDEARRYYTNIVGKYGAQVQNVLKKAEGLDIKMICPLHGPIWNENIPFIMDLYQKWSTYTPEKQGVVIFYGSMYGNTENISYILASKLADKGVKDIRMFDVSKTNTSFMIADAFKYSNLVFACVSYNSGLYMPMETLLNDMKALNLQNRKVSLIGNGTWAISSNKIMKEIIDSMKNMEILGDIIDIKSSLKEENQNSIDNLVEKIYNSL